MNLAPPNGRVAHELQVEISALREAQACITDQATTAEVYGRLDTLIAERMTALEQQMRAMREALERAQLACGSFAGVHHG